jgi:mono/diheme cytochrome c family protein
MLKRVVTVVQVIVLVGVVVWAVGLFLNEPGKPYLPPSAAAGSAGAAGAAIFAANCARCHGRDGGGGIGPQLSDGKVVAAFPSIDDQVAFVTKGQGGMPAFGGTLSAADIRKVVEYTRTL